MFNYPHEESQKGIVNANTCKIDQDLQLLQMRFEATLEPWQIQVCQNLISSFGDLEAIDNGTLTKKGWDCFIEVLNNTNRILDENTNSLILDSDTYCKLEEIYSKAQREGFKGSIEDYLSTLILTIPMPDAK